MIGRHGCAWSRKYATRVIRSGPLVDVRNSPAEPHAAPRPRPRCFGGRAGDGGALFRPPAYRRESFAAASSDSPPASTSTS